MPNAVRTVLIAMVLAGAAVGGVKALMYFNAKQAIDRFIDESADQVNITYGDIATELSGAVAVNAISVRPWDVEEGITIDSLRLDTGDPLYFIAGNEWVPGETAPPGSMNMTLRGMSLDLQSDWMRDLQRQAQAGAEQAGAASPDPCGSGFSTEFDAALLSELGFERIVIDSELSYDIDDDRKLLDATMAFTLRDIQSTEGSLELEGLSSDALGGEAMAAVKFVELSLLIRVEPEFGQRMSRLCAQKRSQTLEAYTDHLLKKAVDNAAQSGLELGPGLREALASFYTDWGNLEISARPAEPLGLLSLVFLPPEQLIETTGLRLSVNNMEVVDTSYRWLGPEQRDLFAEMLSPPSSRTLPPPDFEQYRRIRIERNYRKVAPAELVNHINADVRIAQQGHPAREGRLVSVLNGELAVQQRLHGGKFTAHIPLSEVNSAEVEIVRRVEVKPK